MSLLRVWWRRRRFGYRACLCPWCPEQRSRRGLGLSAWCDEHTDAIYARDKLSRTELFPETTERLATRRWLRQAEVDATLEIRRLEILEAALAQSPIEQKFNHRLWGAEVVERFRELAGHEPGEEAAA